MKPYALLSLLATGTLLAQGAWAEDPEVLFKNKGCVACHAIDTKMVGPAYRTSPPSSPARPAPKRNSRSGSRTAARASGARSRCRRTRSATTRRRPWRSGSCRRNERPSGLPARRQPRLVAGPRADVRLSLPGLADEHPDARRQAQLRHLLLQDCGSCHGLRLTGGLGPALTPRPCAASRANRWSPPCSWAVRKPRCPWAGLLSEDDAGWLVDRLIEGEIAP